jgi:GNAT superfamily N-acetyltransferase
MVTLGAWLRSPASQNDDIRVLQPEDVPSLRLRSGDLLEPAEVLETLESYPGRSVWLPATCEFVLVAPWRHRQEIASVLSMRAPRSSVRLVQAAMDQARTHGADLFAIVESDEHRRAAFYEAVGMTPLEEIITYELDRPSSAFDVVRPVTFRRVLPGENLNELIAIDHAAFPWLWWNSAEEFDAYLTTPDVDVFLGSVDNVPVSYIGTTNYYGWGHLDRIAVQPSLQGQGVGYRSLAYAVAHLARLGARRVALSTQARNDKSRRLYERYGFRRQRYNDYLVYGRCLDDAAPVSAP